MEKVQLIELSPREFVNLIETAVESKLKELGNAVQRRTKPYTRKEAARELQVSLNTLDKWIKEGAIKAHTIGSAIRIKSEDLDKALIEAPTLKYRR